MRFILFMFILFFPVLALGQSIVKQLDLAESQSKNLSFTSAITNYEQILLKPKGLSTEDILRARLGLGEAYFLTKDYINADTFTRRLLKTYPY